MLAVGGLYAFNIYSPQSIRLLMQQTADTETVGGQKNSAASPQDQIQETLPEVEGTTVASNQNATTKETIDDRATPPIVAVLEVDSVKSINPYDIVKTYLTKYKDSNDFLAIFNYGGPRDQYHLTVKNNTKGIYNPDVARGDSSSTYGSSGTLLGIGVVGNIKQYQSDTPIFNVLLEEIYAHYWGVYIGDVIDSTHQLPLQNTLARAHWTTCLNFLDNPDVRYWKASHWEKVGQNKWKLLLPDNPLPRFDPILLYLMGYLDASKVPDVELIIPDSGQKAAYCNQGETIEGTSRIISMKEIIEYLGPREPYVNTKRNYSIGYILVVERGTTPSASSIQTIERVAAGLPKVFQDAITY